MKLKKFPPSKLCILVYFDPNEQGSINSSKSWKDDFINKKFTWISMDLHKFT
jgi:hypothetical protein